MLRNVRSFCNYARKVDIYLELIFTDENQRVARSYALILKSSPESVRILETHES